MVELSLHEIAQVIAPEREQSLPELKISDISTDSRDIPQGCLFLALTGDRFDGHDYIAKALEQGAAFAVAMRAGDYPQDKVFMVEDTRAALLAIAGLVRRKLGLKVAGVTGSVGKTSTRDMTACVLGSTFVTASTRANLNNEVGLSRTILDIAQGTQAAVLEMGMDGPNQIRGLSKCAQPDVGIITNIGVSHLEHLGSREGILAAKLELCDGMADGGTLILNGDDDLLCGVKDSRLKLWFYGIDNPACDVRAAQIHADSTDTTFEILYNGKSFAARIPCLGLHQVRNALAAFSAGVALGVDPQEAAQALANYTPTGMRQNAVVHHGFTVVEDCYNASPDSMKAALETLGQYPCTGRRIAVLSDMLELGAVEVQAHRETGEIAAHSGIDRLLCTGELAKQYVTGAKTGGLVAAEHFQTKDELFAVLRQEVRSGDVVWLKASRGMRLEDILKRIYEEC